MALSFLLLAAIFVLQPLYDPDFWGHLKTGEFIVRTKALLSADPFGPVNTSEVTLREGDT